MPVTLAYAFDENYALPAMVSIGSILRHLPKGAPCKIYALNMGVGAVSQKRVEALVQRFPGAVVEFITVPKDWVAPFKSGAGPFQSASNANFARLFLPELVEDQAVLYLDSDTLAQGDVSVLWQECMEIKQPLGIARDLFGRFGNVLGHLDPEVVASRQRLIERLGLGLDTPYFNCGVMFMNLQILRGERLAETALAFNEREPEARWLPVQSIINTTFHGRIYELDFGWNYQVQSQEFWKYCSHLPGLIDIKKHQPQILHFVSHEKPWNGSCICKKCSY